MGNGGTKEDGGGRYLYRRTIYRVGPNTRIYCLYMFEELSNCANAVEKCTFFGIAHWRGSDRGNAIVSIPEKAGFRRDPGDPPKRLEF